MRNVKSGISEGHRQIAELRESSGAKLSAQVSCEDRFGRVAQPQCRQIRWDWSQCVSSLAA